MHGWGRYETMGETDRQIGREGVGKWGNRKTSGVEECMEEGWKGGVSGWVGEGRINMLKMGKG